MPCQPDFAEIAHTGGKVTITVATQNGRRGHQVKYQHHGQNKIVLLEIRITYDGNQVGELAFGEVPPPGWSYAHIASDTDGKFGHQCPACNQYWRSDPWPTTCPYCGLQAHGLQFLSNAQKIYLQQYSEKLREALGAAEDGEYVIDLDAVADAVGKTEEKPPFYYAEESQQNKFDCRSCGAFNDILGYFGYCASCATRNDLQEIETKTIPQIRDRINAGGPYEACAKDAVAAFDSFTGRYIVQLLHRIPMTPARKSRFEKTRFHNLRKVLEDLKNAFDIDICEGLKPADVEFAALLFHRRHVYEHKGGEADQKYLDDSGDIAVRPKQAIHETQDSAHRLADLVDRMAANLHRGFHEIFPPDKVRIEANAKRQRNG
jgi:hypothetical protein